MRTKWRTYIDQICPRSLTNTPANGVNDLSLNDPRRLLEEALYRAEGNQSEAARILKVSRD